MLCWNTNRGGYKQIVTILLIYLLRTIEYKTIKESHASRRLAWDPNSNTLHICNKLAPLLRCLSSTQQVCWPGLDNAAESMISSEESEGRHTPIENWDLTVQTSTSPGSVNPHNCLLCSSVIYFVLHVVSLSDIPT